MIQDTEKRLVYLGMRLVKMSEELGAEIKPRNLTAQEWIEISKLARNYLLLSFSSLAIVLYVFGCSWINSLHMAS